jgi:flavin reductase (DIM6/NTAB) family NADH-FMN oxidoreductase RutF
MQNKKESLMKTVKYNYESEKAIERIQSGVFLTVKKQSDLNIMTISWCLMGYMWNRPVFQMIVRTSRYTHKIIEKTDSFAVSIPFTDTFNKEIIYCGSHSKRDVDKFKECSLKLLPGKKIDTPVIRGCDLYHECRILTKAKLPAEKIGDDDFNENSKDNHYHIMYYGEILTSYTN